MLYSTDKEYIESLKYWLLLTYFSYSFWSFWSGFPDGSGSKASACNVGDLSSIPGLGRSPWGGDGNPLQYSYLENSMDRGAWWATVHGVGKSWTWLSDFTFFLDHFNDILYWYFILMIILEIIVHLTYIQYNLLYTTYCIYCIQLIVYIVQYNLLYIKMYLLLCELFNNFIKHIYNEYSPTLWILVIYFIFTYAISCTFLWCYVYIK